MVSLACAAPAINAVALAAARRIGRRMNLILVSGGPQELEGGKVLSRTAGTATGLDQTFRHLSDKMRSAGILLELSYTQQQSADLATSPDDPADHVDVGRVEIGPARVGRVVAGDRQALGAWVHCNALDGQRVVAAKYVNAVLEP